MPPKRHYEVGESSNGRTISAEAKARRQAYRESWGILSNQNNEEITNPTPPQSVEEPHSMNAPAPSIPENVQDPNDDSESDMEEGYIVTSAGEKVQFKWGKCLGVGTDPEEDSEEDPEEDAEEDPVEDSEEDPEEDAEEDPMEDSKEDPEEDVGEHMEVESEENPEEDPVEEIGGDIEENQEEDLEGNLEEENEMEIIEEYSEDERESMGTDDEADNEPWEIDSDGGISLDRDEDVGYVDEPIAIEREPEERELSDLEFDGFSSDDDVN